MLTRDILKQVDKYKECEEVASAIEQLKQVLDQQKTLEQQQREQRKKSADEARQQRRELVKLLQSLLSIKGKINREIEALKVITDDCTGVLSEDTLTELKELLHKDIEELESTEKGITETDTKIKEISKKCVHETVEERVTPFGTNKFCMLYDIF